MGKNILITGATGFIGKHVLNELHKQCSLNTDEKYEFTVLSSKPPDNNSLSVLSDQVTVKTIQLDLLSFTDVFNFFKSAGPNKYDILVHLAWGMPNGNVNSLTHVDWLNASINLISNFIKMGGKQVTCAGTSYEYDYSISSIFNEDPEVYPEQFKPTTLYGQCKFKLYNAIKKDLLTKSKNVKFQWARIFNTFGPEEAPNKLVSTVVYGILDNQEEKDKDKDKEKNVINLSHCLHYQDFIYIDDTATAIASLILSDLEGAVNICSGKAVQLKEIVNEILDIMDVSADKRKKLIKFNAVESRFPGKENNQLQYFTIKGNNTRLINDLQYKYKYGSVTDGLKEYIDIVREKKNKK